MDARISRVYGGYPAIQFAPPIRSYHDGYRKAERFFPSAQVSYRLPFNRHNPYTYNNHNQAHLSSAWNRLNSQHRYGQYINQLAREQKLFGRQPGNATTTLVSASGRPPTVYQVEQEIRYVPYPVYIDPMHGGIGAGPFGNNLNFPNNMFGSGMNMSLPPKIRVIFIPTGNSAFQQPCTGPLTMPPFLFNRMAQPFCSFPLPPPLPQLGSLPLTPGVQQMVMQRYVNPVAVLPFQSNWQMPQSMVPSYPAMPPCAAPMSQAVVPYYPPMQQQQQPVMPISSFQPIQPSPQSYAPPATLAPQIMPAVPESYAPSIAQAAPQAYAPEPSPYAASSGAYPSICRACPPAPPSLNIAVSGYCWVQHCSACHHVPISVDSPNGRPVSGRATPLLRYPAVPQYIPEQAVQPQTHMHANAPVMMRPWFRKTPPLPPGAVLISDEYISGNRKTQQHYRSSTHANNRSQRHYTNRRQRSSTVTSAPTNGQQQVHRTTRSRSPKTKHMANNVISLANESVKLTSSHSSSSNESADTKDSTQYEKITLYQSAPVDTAIPPQLTNEARNVNLRYNYQAQELPSVYLINRYLKSSSDSSTLSSDTNRPKANSTSLNENARLDILSSIDQNSQKDETNSLKEEKQSVRSRLSSKSSKRKQIIIREFSTSSPSNISSISSGVVFSVLGKDFDALSTTSTLKAGLSDIEDDDDRKATF